MGGEGNGKPRGRDWPAFCREARDRGMHDRMVAVCQEYGVLLREVYEQLEAGRAKLSVRHARARLFRALMHEYKKDRSELAEMFGVKWHLVDRAVQSGLGYQDWEARPAPDRGTEPAGAPQRVNAEEFVKP